MNTEANTESTRGNTKVREGIVVSNKMDKTIVVATETQVRHKRYGKYVSQTKKFVAHDAKGECAEGDTVRIEETRPLSKTKRWKVIKVVEKAVQV